MLEITNSLYIQIANFLILLLLLNIIVYRPIRNILNKRKEAILSDEERARALNQDTEKYSEDLNRNISDTRKKGINEKETLKSKGLEEEQKMLKDAHSLVEEKINQARLDIEEKKQKARDALNRDIKGFSTDLAEKFLGRGI